jgi:hypothetical protein
VQVKLASGGPEDGSEKGRQILHLPTNKISIRIRNVRRPAVSAFVSRVRLQPFISQTRFQTRFRLRETPYLEGVKRELEDGLVRISLQKRLSLYWSVSLDRRLAWRLGLPLLRFVHGWFGVHRWVMTHYGRNRSCSYR